MAESFTLVRKVNCIAFECKWCGEHSANVEITTIFPDNDYQNRSTTYHAGCIDECGQGHILDTMPNTHFFGITRQDITDAWNKMHDDYDKQNES
jgi:hypothetical protein